MIQALLSSAKGGDVAAARELLQRLLGPPEAIDLLQRLDDMDAKLTQLAAERTRS